MVIDVAAVALFDADGGGGDRLKPDAEGIGIRPVVDKGEAAGVFEVFKDRLDLFVLRLRHPVSGHRVHQAEIAAFSGKLVEESRQCQRHDLTHRQDEGGVDGAGAGVDELAALGLEEPHRVPGDDGEVDILFLEAVSSSCSFWSISAARSSSTSGPRWYIVW